jgi:hypothetical protein
MILKAIVFDQGGMLWHFSLDGGWQSILLAAVTAGAWSPGGGGGGRITGGSGHNNQGHAEGTRALLREPSGVTAHRRARHFPPTFRRLLPFFKLQVPLSLVSTSGEERSVHVRTASPPSQR